MAKRDRQRPKNRFPRRRQGDEGADVDGQVVHGLFRRTDDGHARVQAEDKKIGEIFVPTESFGDARDGDRVSVELRVSRKGKIKGRVIGVTRGKGGGLVGVIMERGRSTVLEPEPLGPDVYVASADLNGAKNRDAVVAEWIRASSDDGNGRAKVVEVLGSIDDPRVQVELVVRGRGWPMEFDDDVLREAESFPAVDPEKVLADGRRKDLRDVLHVTIDGEDARDFDDAVSVRREGKSYRVWVSIADVSHYVTPGSAIDKAAHARATSVYFPDRVLPMLPEALSNDLCSLRPHRPRLTMTCEMVVDASGAVSGEAVYASVIESADRLTYEQVQAVFDSVDGKSDAENSTDPGPAAKHRDFLVEVRDAARRFRADRAARGALDLDLPESKVTLDATGRAVGIGRRERQEAHRVIEDLMIGANEAVARHTAKEDWPALYRIHEAPDPKRLSPAAEWAERFQIDFDIDGAEDPKILAAFIAAIRTHEAADVMQMLALRSLAQARYSPENAGHYGLASQAYLHFTSPIRRYPDLFVHRSLRAKWDGKKRLTADLEELGEHCSVQERAAVDAERAVMRLMECQVAAKFVGTTTEAMVTGVHTVGAFVRARRPLVEGLLPIGALGDHYGEYLEVDPDSMTIFGPKSGSRLTVGDKLTVRIGWVNLARRQIDFEIAEEGVSWGARKPEGEPKTRRGPGRGPSRNFERSGRGGASEGGRKAGAGRKPSRYRDDDRRSGGVGATDDERPPSRKNGGKREKPKSGTGPRRAGKAKGGGATKNAKSSSKKDRRSRKAPGTKTAKKKSGKKPRR